MCAGASVPKARPIEQQKPAVDAMGDAADDVARRQSLRRGLMSSFSEERGLLAQAAAPGLGLADKLG